MMLIYRNSNASLVGLAKGLLENAGIEVMIKNEFAGGGGFPPYNLEQELWLLDENNLSRAQELLAEVNDDGDIPS